MQALVPEADTPAQAGPGRLRPGAWLAHKHGAEVSGNLSGVGPGGEGEGLTSPPQEGGTGSSPGSSLGRVGGTE